MMRSRMLARFTQAALECSNFCLQAGTGNRMTTPNRPIWSVSAGHQSENCEEITGAGKTGAGKNVGCEFWWAL
jgi:hypothetical protein